MPAAFVVVTAVSTVFVGAANARETLAVVGAAGDAAGVAVVGPAVATIIEAAQVTAVTEPIVARILGFMLSLSGLVA